MNIDKVDEELLQEKMAEQIQLLNDKVDKLSEQFSQITKDLKVDSHLPRVIDDFESLYDSTTGGWYMPAAQSFTPKDLKKYLDLKETLFQTPNYASVELEVGRMFYWVTKLIKPKLVLETGTNIGYSTSMIANAMWDYTREGSLITIDLLKTPHLWDEQPFAPLIRFIEGNSLNVKIVDMIFDMLVLDSDHSYGTVMRELIRFEPMLAVGGVILLHDSLYFDGVGLAVEQLYENPRFDVVTLPTPRNHGKPSQRCPGLTIVRKLSNQLNSAPLTFREDLKLKFRHDWKKVNVLMEGGNMQNAYLDIKRIKS